MNRFSTCSLWLLLIALAIGAFTLIPAAPALSDPGTPPGTLALPLLGMAGIVNVRGLFVPAAVARYLKALPIINTPVIDIIYSNRPQHPLALLAADDLTPVVHALPLVKRGAPSIPATKESGAAAFYEPFPIRPNSFVTGVDLNNLKLLSPSSQELWAQNRTDKLRRGVRMTSEALAAQSISGRILYPVALEGGGFDLYDVDFGAISTVEPGTLWDANGIKVKNVFDNLTAMQEKLQENGYGGTIELWAGKLAYGALFAICEDFKSTAQLRVEISDQGINVGGFLVKRRAERYRHPQTGVMTPIVADKVVKMVAMDAGHFMPYCALDDLDSNLQPMPMLVKPIKLDDPSGYKLVGESKPFPVPNVKGICDCTVLG